MFKMVRQRFYWPGMYQDVQNFCQNCLRCIISKDVQPKVRTVMNTIQASKPLEVVALDLRCWNTPKVEKKMYL